MVEYGLIRAVSAVLEGARRNFPTKRYCELRTGGSAQLSGGSSLTHSLTKAFEKVLEARS
jgi:hypothetical protein